MEIGIVIIVVVIIVGLFAYNRGRKQGAAEVTSMVSRVQNLQKMAETRRFFTPENPDPNPDFEYCNAFQKRDTSSFDLTFFDHTGLQSTRNGLTTEEMQALVKAERWQMIAQTYSTDAGGSTYQYVRRKPA